MSIPLLTTKFFVPPAPPNDLPRQRLFEQLDQVLAAGRRLALVCAPAGYGKTTLAADWIRALRQKNGGLAPEQLPIVSWLSLEANENDLQQFLLYLITGLRRVLPENAPGQAARDEELAFLLQAINSAVPETVLAGVVNVLSALPENVLLVLDDYQAIQTPAVHSAVIFLCEHLPPNAHLVITSRSDPPLPLHRYRARGQVIEIRMDALRLTQPEVDRLLEQENARSGDSVDTRPSLGPVETGLLTERTEGWPAGIQMALLSLRGKDNPREFIHSWTGSQRFMLDYLSEEVVQNQPPVVQRFLVQTAILDRFCAPLCEALGAGSFVEKPTTNERIPAQDIIAGLERDNLFLIPLDEEAASGAGAGWFRYHHLFLDLLLVRLKQAGQKEPGLEASLHRRAAAWLEANGWLRESIQHFIRAQDYPTAARLVEQHTLRLFSEGELQSLVGWIRLLPKELADSRPWLRIYQAWALAFAGDLLAARQLCLPVEEMLQGEGDLAPEERRRLRADLVGIRALTGLMSGEVREVLALENLPADTFPDGSLFAQSAVHWALGYAWRMLGDLPRATAAFQAMQQAGFQTNNNWTILSAAVDLGLVLRLTGRLRDAEALYRNGLERVERAGTRGAGFVGRIESFLANILYEKNELVEASQLAQSSVRHNRYWNNPNHTAHACGVMARIRLGQGDLAGAREALREMERIAAEQTIVPPLHAMLDSLRVRLWLAENDLPQAARWLESRRQPAGDPAYLRTEVGETQGIAMARARLALGDREGARALLAQLEETARANSHTNALIEIRILTALSAPGQNAAHAALREALSLGCPEGYTRVFLDEGEPLRKLIEEALGAVKRERPGSSPHPLAGCMQSLLGQFERISKPETAPTEKPPLTDRELDILRAIAEGLSNPEIGRRLYISAGTVKAHSAAIYRKLDVANRTEAIAKAKDMGLV